MGWKQRFFEDEEALVGIIGWYRRWQLLRPTANFCLVKLAQLQWRNKEHAKALASIDEAVVMARVGWYERPERHGRLLAWALIVQAGIRDDLGRPNRVLDSAQEAEDVARVAAETAPKKAVPLLQQARLVRAGAYYELDRFAEALVVTRRTVRTARSVYAEQPSVEAGRMLGAALGQQGVVEAALDRIDDAIGSLDEALSVQERFEVSAKSVETIRRVRGECLDRRARS
ncbi:hypothetical protein D5S17_05275 [Pseudonocardiaceae bacterium YIM PH 21723]|nr:hypothetical protein D5S17_05275 [Pseudonocardiaceae bacterium YIM PH 21723]